MNLRFVEAFHWVVTLKSVSKAARRLFLTQSAMSARVAALEQELGVLLLDRRDKSFRLTVAGTRFAAYALQLLELQRHVMIELGAPQEQTVSLRVGAIESALHSWLIPWISHVRQAYPALELELTVETTPVLTDQMQGGVQDIIFAAAPATGNAIRMKELPPMAMVFVGQSSMHERRLYHLAQLAQGDLLTFQRGSQPFVALADALRSGGITAKKVHAISSISAMVQLVQAGFGVATLPQAAIASIQQRNNLKVLTCDVPLAPLPIYASFRADPTTGIVDAVVKSALTFNATHGVKVKTHQNSASKKSMRSS